eukprot:Em0023g487a
MPQEGHGDYYVASFPYGRGRLKMADSDQPDHESNTILMASSMAPHCFASRSLPEPHEMAETEERVEAKGLPAQHVLVIQVRDEPLVPPPTEPPPPVLQAPFYLGLRHRQCRAGDPPPPPPPPPVEPQFVRVILPLQSADRSVIVFRRPSSYAHRHICTNLQLKVDTSSGTLTVGKKTASSSSVKGESPEIPDIQFVDSMEPIELLFVLSSLSNWLDGGKSMFAVSRPSLGPRTFLAGEEVHDQVGTDATAQECVVAGSLTVEPYSWRNVLPTPPVLKLTTSGRCYSHAVSSTREALPKTALEGTSCLSPGGSLADPFCSEYRRSRYQPHVQGASKVQAPMSTVLTECPLQESKRFQSHCRRLMEAVVSGIECGGEDVPEEKMQSLLEVHQALTQGQAKLLQASVVKTLRLQADRLGLSTDMLFAWKAYLAKLYGALIPSLKPSDQSELDHIATMIAAIWCPSRLENEEAVGVLKESAKLLTQHLEEIGTAAFGHLMKTLPQLVDSLPFASDEKTRSYHQVYKGTSPTLQPSSWCILFREVFHMPEDQVLVPHLQCSLNTSLLRVIDNDTGVEVPSFFHCIQPHLYSKNKSGYTFVGEAWTHEKPSDEGSWLLRVVLDSQQSFYCTDGWGHCVIPVCSLHPSRLKTISEEGSACDEEKSHKYVLEATVMNNTWPISDSAWNFVATQKSAEKLEDNKPSSGRKSKLKEKEKGSGGDKGAATKKGATTPLPTARSSASQIDTTKPHWTLRIVTTTSDKEHLEVSKDTERVDELKSMIQAWEAEQPGRTKKGMESRQKFLESQGLSREGVGGGDEDQCAVVILVSEMFSPQPFSTSVSLKELDLSSFYYLATLHYLISEKFGINGASGLQLYLDDFLLPMNEDAAIVRDNDRIQVRVVGCQKSSIPSLTSMGNPLVFTAVESDGASEPHKDKTNKKRKRKDSVTEGEVAPVEHGSCISPASNPAGQPTDMNETRITEKELPSDTKPKRKRKSQPSEGSTTSTAPLCVPAGDKTAYNQEEKEAAVGKKLNDMTPTVPPQAKKKKKELHAVATKTTIGSLHVRFHSDSSGSEPEEAPPVTAKKSKVARGKDIAKETESDSPTEVTSKNPNCVTRPGQDGTQTKELGAQKEANYLPRKPKQRKSRHKKLTSDTIVGGSDDIFTTRTNVYISNDQGASEIQSGTEGTYSVSQVVNDKQHPVEDFAEPVLKLDQQPASTDGASESVSQPVKRNYDTLPDLRGPPRVGDQIAFKLLELSVNCTPEVSSYKEGRVISVSLDTVQIELSKESTQQHEEISEESALAKFRLPDSDQSEEDEENPRKPSEVESVIELPLEALLQPKLL